MQHNITDLKGEIAKKAGNQKKDSKPPEPTAPQNAGCQQAGVIRLLRADEIECRVSAVKENGVSLLLYKDARVDQRILDETFGPFGWQRSHQCIDGNLYCTVAVYDRASGIWVSKQDVGTTGYTEKEKSQASDSFKRACFNWGIGRELYSAPFIWVTAGKASIKEDKNKKRFYCNDHFSVRSIGYNGNREITSLIVVNDSSHGQVVYEMQAGNQAAGTGSIQLSLLEREMERTGICLETVLARYNIQSIRQMTPEIYTNALNSLRKTKSKGAA